jgi:hypothetical protein
MASDKKAIRYFGKNWWMFGRDKVRERVADLRASYGDNCWQCGHPMSFHPMAIRRGATIEHLLAKKHGGTSKWENIRLCHRGCNWHLGVHPPDQKLRMRLRLARETVPAFTERVRTADPVAEPAAVNVSECRNIAVRRQA